MYLVELNSITCYFKTLTRARKSQEYQHMSKRTAPTREEISPVSFDKPCIMAPPTYDNHGGLHILTVNKYVYVRFQPE
jgi:hypothetical protein